tara:strand:- start:355 stop:591 length:237 start_codon:yes stop_codon:yes gene_type:complete
MTKQDKIAALKTQYPTLRVGSEEVGYTELSAEDYEAKIAEWADNELAAEAELAKAEADKEALLAKLGITADEAKLLLS